METAKEMTSRERMLTALNNREADCVPVTPDISFMIPMQLSGKDFFSIIIDEEPPLWQAYIDAVKYFDFDGWFIYGNLGFETKDVTKTKRWLEETDERRIEEISYRTPQGQLTEQILHTLYNPPVCIKKLIEDVDRDWPRYKYLLGEIVSTDDSVSRLQRQAFGQLGIYGFITGVPGLPLWHEHFQGGIETLSYIMIDRPEILDELRDLHEARFLAEMKHYCKAQPDFVLMGSSGSITLASPQLWRKYAFPTLKKQIQMCSDAGILSILHSCGKEKYIVETCARETTLNNINPLEIPPMGDITLAEAKAIVAGTNLTLMGNLHTTDIMLHGNVNQVKSAVRKAIDDAAEGGGFILSTGDQCGRDTPFDNIFAMVEEARTYGKYDQSPNHIN